MVKLLIIGLGGFIGAVCRYGVGGWVQRWGGGTFPYGTLIVNVTGCFLIGIILMLSEQRQLFSPHTRLFLTVGILGAFTTFSTFGYETLELLRDRNLQAVAINILANVMCGLLAVWAGVALVRMVWR